METDAPILETPAPRKKTTRHPLVALLLSLFAPGLGQIYNGQLRKGVLLFLVVYGIVLAAGISDVAHVIEGLALIVIIEIALRLYIIVDATVVAARKRLAPWETYNRWYWHLAIFIGMIGMSQVFPLQTILGIASFNIPTSSQEPTLMVGDRLVADMRYYNNTLPQYGDLVVYYPNHAPGELYISRVMGLPGDEVEIIDRQFYINGTPLPQRFVASVQITYKEFYGEENYYGSHHFPDGLTLETVQEELPNGHIITVQYTDFSNHARNMKATNVPKGTYFLTGDNRDNSLDSRYSGIGEPFGTIPLESIKGKGLYIFWAKDKSRIGTKPK